MFTDPQSVTYSSEAKSLPAVSRSDGTSEYRLNDAGVVYTLTLSRQLKTRNRVLARLRRDAVAADPLVPSQNIPASASAAITIDFPMVGVTPAAAQSLCKALIGWATDANILKLVNGET